MGKVFKQKERYVIDQNQRWELEEKLVEQFYFSIEAIPNFVTGLASNSAWEISENSEVEKDYNEVSQAYLTEVWPDFETQMLQISSSIYSNRSDIKSVEEIIFKYVDFALDDFVILWALTQPTLKNWPGSNLEKVLPLVDTFEKACVFNPEQNPMDFGRWVLNDWLGPHLRYFNQQIETEKKELEKIKMKSSKVKSTDSDQSESDGYAQ